MTNVTTDSPQTTPIVSRRTAFRGLGLAGLAAAGGLLVPTTRAQAADHSLVVVDQMGTGTFEGENCGPAAAVIALVAAGNTPDTYVSASNGGAAVGGNSYVVKDMRAYCGLSPWGSPGVKSVDYWGAYLEDLQLGISEYGSTSDYVSYSNALDAAADGSPVILHVWHNLLIGDASADYGHFVTAQGTDSNGNIMVSDPGRAQSIGITAYSRDHLLNARRRDAIIVS